MSSTVTRVFRGDRLESVHRAHVVVLEEGRLAGAEGDPDAVVYPRSALKPLQALPLFVSGDPARLGLDDNQCAILCASHSGDAGHVDCVRTIQRAAGVLESALECGPHQPFDTEEAQRLIAVGESPLPIHNNCSGKHTGFLISCARHDAPHSGYLDPEHPVQLEVCDLLGRLTDIASTDLEPGIDGCGAPNWPLPLSKLAALFRDLANPERLPAELRDGAGRIFEAVNAAPHFLAGRDRFDTALLRATPGAFLGKCGAEGVFALGVRASAKRPAFGIAIKVEDGAKRCYEHFLPHLLADIGLLDRTEPTLAPFFDGRIRNTQGRVIGHLESIWDPAFADNATGKGDGL